MAPASEYSDETVVVRGGKLLSGDLQKSAEGHHAEFPDTGYAISVFLAPGMSAGQIAAAARIPHKTVRSTTAGQLREAGWRLEPDEGYHANLFLPDAPSEMLWQNLRALFANETENSPP